jgi:predicted porin
MNKKALVLAIGAALAAPVVSADVDLLGKAVQVYGKLHASADVYDKGTTTATITEPNGVEITSNSSRLGFKGEKELKNGVNGLWKFESEIDLTGETGTLSARNRYVGVGGAWGNVILGIHDTPLKDIAANFTLFGDTIGDYRSMLGQLSSNTNQFNQRAMSMAMYQVKAGGFSGSLMYSPDFATDTDPDSGDTGVGDKLLGAGIGFKTGGFDIGAAYEKQDSINNTLGANATAFRVGVKYKIGDLQVGGVFESLKDDGFNVRAERNGYALNLSYKIAGITLGGQYMKAEESGLTAGNDGADQFTLGMYYDLGKDAQLYLVHGQLDNDANASFQLARSGHGQAFAPTRAGETVTATSVGVIYNF